jgi:hypothetical protein
MFPDLSTGAPTLGGTEADTLFDLEAEMAVEHGDDIPSYLTTEGTLGQGAMV